MTDNALVSLWEYGREWRPLFPSQSLIAVLVEDVFEVADASPLSEDDQQVRYSFGAEHADMHRTLVVNKDTVRPEPEDGKPDYEFRKAAGKIVITFRDQGEWPQHGFHASY